MIGYRPVVRVGDGSEPTGRVVCMGKRAQAAGGGGDDASGEIVGVGVRGPAGHGAGGDPVQVVVAQGDTSAVSHERGLDSAAVVQGQLFVGAIGVGGADQAVVAVIGVGRGVVVGVLDPGPEPVGGVSVLGFVMAVAVDYQGEPAGLIIPVLGVAVFRVRDFP